MNSIEVLAPGLLTTVQDLGREGHGPEGVSASGAADPVALQLGNLLLDNPPGTAALEMTLVGGTFVFPAGAAIALTGSDFGAELNQQPVELWKTCALPSGAKLSLGPTRDGARCYLCIAGGISVEPFLGSASTHLLSGLGGFHGRALRKGDILPIGPHAAERPQRKLPSRALYELQPKKTLRATDGPQADFFPEEVRRLFYNSAFRVTEEADRLGLRLEGPALANTMGEMITEGVSLGAVQITPSGQPIILFVEQQTTGGYPKIANIIGADLYCVGQLRPRDSIRFERVSLQYARSLWIAQQRWLASGAKLFT